MENPWNEPKTTGLPIVLLATSKHSLLISLRDCLLSCLFLVSAADAQVIYVDAAASGGGDGTSWGTAYDNLQDGLNNAFPGDQIWIAKGTYRPTEVYSPDGVIGGAYALSAGFDPANLPRLVTFNVPDGVSLYGGFAGTETAVDQRKSTPGKQKGKKKKKKGKSLDKLRTVLSGDVGVIDDESDNAWHVVLFGNDVAATGATASMNGLTIEDGRADADSSAIGATFAHSWGGGIYADSGSNIVLENVVLRNNFARVFGGGVSVYDVSLGISNSSFYGNVVGSEQSTGGSGDGGAIFGVFSDIDIGNSDFSGNFAFEDGGAIHIRASSLDIYDSDFSDNTAFGIFPEEGRDDNGFGGAIESAEGSATYISGSNFTANNSDMGGAVAQAFGNNASFVIVSSEFDSNNAETIGGALVSIGLPGHTLEVYDTVFSNNTAGLGGAVFSDSTATVIADSKFEHNIASEAGGAVSSTAFQGAGTVTVQNSKFHHNDALGVTSQAFRDLISLDFGVQIPETDMGGGAIANSLDAVLSVQDSTFKHNSAFNSNGGAISNGGLLVQVAPGFAVLGGGTTAVENSTISHNEATNGGGIASGYPVPGFVVLTPLITALTTTNSDIKKNFASSNGGGVAMQESNFQIMGNKFENNAAVSLGEAIYAESSSGTLVNNELKNNNVVEVP